MLQQHSNPYDSGTKKCRSKRKGKQSEKINYYLNTVRAIQHIIKKYPQCDLKKND